jgi:predicted nucleic acid-binding protein
MSAEFLDTNVLVYAHDRTAGAKRRVATDLVNALIGRKEAVLSTQVLVEFAVTVTQKIPVRLSLARTAEILRDLAVLRVVSPTAGDVLAAAELARRYSVSMWDAMILRAAASAGVSVVWSEDLGHGQSYDGVEVRNPFRDV